MFPELIVTLGLGLGYGSTDDGVPKIFNDNVTGKVETRSAVYQAFAALRYKHIGLEGGFLELPRYQSYVDIKDYGAYRHIECPPITTASATQTITAHSFYARGNVFGPDWIVTPYAFAGAAYVATHNHEHALYDGHINNDFDRTFNKWAPYYGVGLQKTFGQLAIRAEVAQIRGASDSYWTGRRDANFGTVAIGWSFK